jgi:hypothetical protein
MVAKHNEGECSFVAQHTDGNAISAASGESDTDTYQPFASLAELKNQFDRSE